MEDYKDKLKEKSSNSCNICASSFLLICYLILYVFIIIWLFKLNNNTKSEPNSRESYIIEDPSAYYREDEFCYEKYEPFIAKGALDIFNIPTKNIRKYCKALISTIFISIGSIILGAILVLSGSKSYGGKRDWLMCFGSLFYLFFYLGVISSLVFAIILIHYYSKGDYSDFQEFSRCRYLSRKFRKDYEFVFNIKDEYQMPFAIIIITEFFNFVKLIAENNPNDDS
jgi:hypothetical protein